MGFLVTRSGEDLEPTMMGQLCKSPVALESAWLAFEPLDHAEDRREAIVVHQACLRGSVAFVSEQSRLVTWRCTDVVSRLLKPSDDVLAQMTRDPRHRPYHRSNSHAVEHPLPVRLRQQDRHGFL